MMCLRVKEIVVQVEQTTLRALTRTSTRLMSVHLIYLCVTRSNHKKTSKSLPSTSTTLISSTSQATTLMWVEYFKSTSSSTTSSSSSSDLHEQQQQAPHVAAECIMCGKSFGHKELCIGMNSVVGIETLFPFHPKRTLWRVLMNERAANYNSSTHSPPPCFLHLDCFIPQIHRPFQCMFDYEEKGEIEKEDQQMLSKLIIKWQAMRRNANAKKRKKNKELQEKTKKNKTRVKKGVSITRRGNGMNHVEEEEEQEEADDDESFLVNEESIEEVSREPQQQRKSNSNKSSKTLSSSKSIIDDSGTRVQTRLQKKKELFKKDISKVDQSKDEKQSFFLDKEEEESRMNFELTKEGLTRATGTSSSLGGEATHPDASFTLQVSSSSSFDEMSFDQQQQEQHDQMNDPNGKVEWNRTSLVTGPSPYLLGLSDEIWYEILQYLPFDSLLQLSQISRSMFYYSSMNSLWESLCVKFLCPRARSVQEEYFPTLDYKTLFRKLYDNCCIQCGEYLRLDVELDNAMTLAQSKGSIQVPTHPDYYHYLVDHCVCEKCQKSSALSTISKTEAKRIYFVNDRDFNALRCMKSPNPFHRSTAMFKFLRAQLQQIHNKNVEQVLKGYYHFSQNHSQKDFSRIIEDAKHGKYGKECKLYHMLNFSTKQEVNGSEACAYIDTLEVRK